ncbi:MAG TPA: hypothetical protein VGM57_07535 [Pseudolabrys sp.]
MSSLAVKLFAGVVAFAFIVPVQAETARKHKKHTAVHAMAQAPVKYRGTDKFPAGPIYDGHTYLGDDPDPFIRSQLARDVNAIYGGNN